LIGQKGKFSFRFCGSSHDDLRCHFGWPRSRLASACAGRARQYQRQIRAPTYARGKACDRKGATLQHPERHDTDMGFLSFPSRLFGRFGFEVARCGFGVPAKFDGRRRVLCAELFRHVYWRRAICGFLPSDIDHCPDYVTASLGISMLHPECGSFSGDRRVAHLCQPFERE
jgi:hypothetical protein